MAGLTDNGLEIKSLTQIISEFQTALRTQLGNDIDVSDNSILGILNSILGAGNADEWELSQAIYDAFNINTATGKQLDDLAQLLKITRLEATASNGSLSLFGDQNTVVPTGTLFSDTLGNTYESTEQGDLTLGTSRTPVNISGQIGVGQPGDPSTIYSLTINGDVYSYQTLWPQNSEDFIANQLKSLVPTSGLTYSVETRSENNPEFINEVITYTNTAATPPQLVNSLSYINVINLDESNTITVSVQITNSITPTHESLRIPFMGVGSKIATFVDSINVIAQDTGAIITAANTVNIIDTPVSGLDSVTNPLQFVIGRALETDEQLRARFKASSAINGNATVPSIEDKINQIDGVTKAFVVENRNLSTDTKGRPGKSYEVVVVGGSDQDIGITIWNSKPAGIETFGAQSVQITDSQGRFQTVNFSRSTSIFVWAKAYYTKYDEETFPLDGETLMSASIVSTGNSLDLGEDVIPPRFFGPVYSSTNGIQNLRIVMATSADSVTEPPIGDFTDQAISIEDDEIANFVSARVEIIEE